MGVSRWPEVDPVRLHRLRNSPRTEYGFSLIEVLLAMGLFLIGVTALLGLFQYGGGMESGARAHSELAPAIEPLVEELVQNAWLLDASGGVTTLREIRGEVVPGAPDYRYDLLLDDANKFAALQRAQVRFYRKSPDRPVARISFLLPREVPLDRRIQESKP